MKFQFVPFLMIVSVVQLLAGPLDTWHSRNPVPTAEPLLRAAHGNGVTLLVGVLGGFTTFSSFGLDTHALARGGELGAAVLNVAGQVGLGLAAVWAGFLLSGGR